MAKRKLSRRQAWRVQKIQEERLARAERKARQSEAQLQEGALSAERYGLVISNYGDSLEIEDSAGQRTRCHLRSNLETPAVGDRVVWQSVDEGTGVVSAISPRASLLARPDAWGKTRTLAANVDQILVVAAAAPPYSLDFIDQYLIAAEQVHIAPVVVFNKVDLLDSESRARFQTDFAVYERLGYPVITASCKTRHGLDALVEQLRDKVSVFAGQSGVGKSSLVHALLPGETIELGELSERTGLGQHTTSVGRLYHLPDDGSIIDSPGVREFRLWPLGRDELAGGFPEFAPHLGHCRFRDCRHQQEPGCALREAVEHGDIDPRRFVNFQRLATEMEEELAAREPGRS